MKRSLRSTLLMGVVTTVAGVGAALAVPAAAYADTVICDQYGSTTIASGKYIVQNNRWGTSATQCITVTSTGFKVTTQNGVNPTNSNPVSYPSVYWGCHYGNCSTGFNPIQASASTFSNIKTSASLTYPSSGYWDASYDIWFDPTARRDGQNTGIEVMVWLNHMGPPQPIGSKKATVSLAGGTWDVWYGPASGWTVVSYVRTSATGSASFNVSTFYNDAVTRGYAQRSWYLTSIQLGFEPWQGGVGLAVNSFSAG